MNITGLYRSLDLRHGSNRFIGLVALLAGLVAYALGLSWLGIAGATFATWALARELDPDHPITACVAAVLLGLMIFFVPQPAQLELFLTTGFLMVGARAISCSTGTPATILDWLGVLTVAVPAAAFGLVSWLVVLYWLAAFLTVRLKWWAVGIVWLGVLIVLAFSKLSWWLGLTGLLAVVSLAVLLASPPNSRNDQNQPLEFANLLAAHFLMWAAVFALVGLGHQMAILGVLTIAAVQILRSLTPYQ